jgi:hypothetical protein
MAPVQPTKLGFSCEWARVCGCSPRAIFPAMLRRAPALAFVVLLAGCGSGGGGGTTTSTVAALKAVGRQAEGFRPVPPSATQRQAGPATVFPVRGTLAASPETAINFRGTTPDAIRPLHVSGSKSGVHAGQLVADHDGAGASFVPDKPFAPGETVTVAAALRLDGDEGGRIAFTVATPVTEPPPHPQPGKKIVPTVEHLHAFPGVPVTPLKVTTVTPRASKGLVLLGPKQGAGHDALEILDRQGRIVWYRPNPPKTGTTDFRVQTYNGKQVLTWWEGHSLLGHGYGVGVVADEHYRHIATVRAGDGYDADLHEFELTSRGTALITIYKAVKWDLSPVGGPKDGAAIDSIVQEVEVGTGRVLFEWHSLGTVPLEDSYDKVVPGQPFDYFHVNAITTDGRGNLLVSGRGTHTLYDLDGRTGEILWQLGGKHSSVGLGDGVHFHSQHDGKWLDANTLSIFDNGAGVGEHEEKRSRGIVVRLDPDRKHARLVADFPQPVGGLYKTQGNIQRLSDGNWFVGWGEGPWATEFAPDGTVVWQLKFVSGQSYRTYASPWVGRPAAKPVVVVDGGTAYASWNGSTEVRRWQLLAGGKVVATKPWAGLETAIALPAGATDVQVRALGAGGQVLASSPARRP